MTTPAGWYDDGSGKRRWWDGSQWTMHVTTSVPDTPEWTPPTAPAIRAAATAGAPATRRISVFGLVGLIAAAIGAVLACIPPITVAGWALLGAAVVVSLVSLFLPGTKWPGVTGLGVAAFGTVLALAVSLFTVGLRSVVEAADDATQPTAPSAAPSRSPAPMPTDDPAPEGAEMVPFAELEVGDCLPLVEYESDEDIYELPVLPCDVPHTDEVFFIYELDDGEFPGDEYLTDKTWEDCRAHFEAFVGVAYDDSELDFYSYQPTRSSWIRAGDRTVHCIVFSYDEVTGSLAGAGR
ncbi:septum formation family protein [Microbacterium sp. 179-I 3D3 NHS]|uniref:septum formation family protein n=1 Tax=Microbacterium sp. 179-I 3D3 NHS TaxID=3142382 RepID=UPI0039A16829